MMLFIIKITYYELGDRIYSLKKKINYCHKYHQKVL